MNVVLIGVRGSGKSTIGAMLAERLGMKFVDLDREIERRTGCTIDEIMKAPNSERSFREQEFKALRGLVGMSDVILATGGGVVEREDNNLALCVVGKVVWLQVTPEEAVRRTEHEPRPPLTDLPSLEEARDIADRRASTYGLLADHVIDTNGKTPEDVCDELQQLW